MVIIKVINKTLTSIGQAISDTAEMVSIAVGDRGLKTTTTLTFGIINNSLEESHERSKIETRYNLQEFLKKHPATKVGRPPKNKGKK